MSPTRTCQVDLVLKQVNEYGALSSRNSNSTRPTTSGFSVKDPTDQDRLTSAMNRPVSRAVTADKTKGMTTHFQRVFTAHVRSTLNLY